MNTNPFEIFCELLDTSRKVLAALELGQGGVALALAENARRLVERIEETGVDALTKNDAKLIFQLIEQNINRMAA